MKILIADRDRDFLDGYRELLTMDGHEVKTAFDGTQVLTKAAGGGFDMIVMSARMPRIDSREILRYLNEEGIPVILIAVDRKVLEPFAGMPVLGTLEFPFEPEALRSLLRIRERELLSQEKESKGGGEA